MIQKNKRIRQRGQTEIGSPRNPIFALGFIMAVFLAGACVGQLYEKKNCQQNATTKPISTPDKKTLTKTT